MLIRPRWRKMLRDMWRNKTRTLLVVLSIAIGVFAIGMIATSRTILSEDLTASYAATNPASASISVSNPQIGGSSEGFDEDLVQAVRRMDAVEAAEGRRSLGVRLQVGPGQWRDLQLFAIPDYEDMQINKIWPERGVWPPSEKELLIERAALGLTNAEVGDSVLVKMPDGTEREMRVVGLVHDLSQLPSFLDGTIYGYVTFDTLEWLGAPRDFNQMNIVVAEHKDNKPYIQYVANEVSHKIEKSGHSVLMKVVPEPGKHPLRDVIHTKLPSILQKLLPGSAGILPAAMPHASETLALPGHDSCSFEIRLVSDNRAAAGGDRHLRAAVKRLSSD
jgi:putative ABC transport system permease protein